MRTSVKGGKEDNTQSWGVKRTTGREEYSQSKKQKLSFLWLLDPMSLGRKGRKKKYGDTKYPHRVIGDSGLWK